MNGASGEGLPREAGVVSEGRPANGGDRGSRSRGESVVELVNVSKSFGGVRALLGVDFAAERGRVEALLGENGAGKSTLIKVMTGLVRPDEGYLVVEGTEYGELTPRQARDLGISVVTQELSLFPDLSVAANALIGREPRGRFGMIDYHLMNRMAAEAVGRLGVGLDPEQPMRELGFADRQLVEIAKALAGDPRVLVLDEPTSGLREAEVERLFGVVRGLAAAGTSVVFIGHRMSEVLEIADSITVLKDGSVVGRVPRTAAEPGNLVRLMVGREIEDRYPPKLAPSERSRLRAERPALEARGFAVPNSPVEGLDLDLWAGEVCGLAGLRGQGQTQLLEGLFGVRPSAGSLRVGDARGPFGHPARAIDAGMALVPEDRKNEGLVLGMSVRENITLPSVDRFARVAVVRQSAERERAGRIVGELDVRPRDPETPADGLSGGNQQKVSLGKWLLRSPRVLLLADPTRGVDVATKQEMFGLVRRLADEGMCVLYLSTEMTEIIGLCDRALVMFEGSISAELEGDDVTEDRLAAASLGEVDA